MTDIFQKVLMVCASMSNEHKPDRYMKNQHGLPSQELGSSALVAGIPSVYKAYQCLMQADGDNTIL